MPTQSSHRHAVSDYTQALCQRKQRLHLDTRISREYLCENVKIREIILEEAQVEFFYQKGLKISSYCPFELPISFVSSHELYTEYCTRMYGNMIYILCWKDYLEIG